MLAIATNLPEIAITASAALAHQLDVAVGNILGGIALQTVVLVVLDAAGVRPRKPLTYLAASLTLLLEGRSEEHTSELQSPVHLVCRLLLEKKKYNR